MLSAYKGPEIIEPNLDLEPSIRSHSYV